MDLLKFVLSTEVLDNETRILKLLLKLCCGKVYRIRFLEIKE